MRDSLRFAYDFDFVGADYFRRNALTAGAGIGAMKALNTFRFDQTPNVELTGDRKQAKPAGGRPC